jgi:type I restriction enzyme M protein
VPPGSRPSPSNQTPLLLTPPAGEHLDVSALESWLWEAACAIRGPLDAPKYKDYILPLLFYKRLCDVYEDEIKDMERIMGDAQKARAIARYDRHVVRFCIPDEHTWQLVRRSTERLGERLTDAMNAIARENPKLQGVVNRRDFNATEAGQRLLEDDTLARLMEILNQHRLGLGEVESDILGRAYEYLLRKFAEGSGQSAGEFFTPREVGLLMAAILDPREGESVYDPACGSGGLLIKAQLRLRETIPAARGLDPRDRRAAETGRPLQLFGQEINPDTLAMARMNAFIHDMEADIQRGDTMRNPRFLDADGHLRRFDKVTANPMWNQNFPVEVYERDTYDRFASGYPPASSADWGWIQHMAASLEDGGKMAVVLDTGAASRGSGNQGSNKERDIRRAFAEAGWIEAVILLPENLFYNTTAPGIILVVSKAGAHAGQILLINASSLCAKGRPKNYLAPEHIERIQQLYRGWQAEPGLSAVITTDEAARNDFNLSPSRYVASNDHEPPLPLEEALVLLAEAEEECRTADAELDDVLIALGFANWRGGA